MAQDYKQQALFTISAGNAAALADSKKPTNDPLLDLGIHPANAYTYDDQDWYTTPQSTTVGLPNGIMALRTLTLGRPSAWTYHDLG